MEFKEVIGRRRSILYFLPYRPVEREKIKTIMEATRISSCAVNASFLRAIVVERDNLSPDDLEALKVPTTTLQLDMAPVHIYFYGNLNAIQESHGQTLKEFYDEIWIYGLPQVCEPLAGLDLPASVSRKITYTGYLQRFADTNSNLELPSVSGDRPFILVTPGGGGDGEELVDWVLRAYEHDSTLPHPSLVVLGPFMQSERRTEFIARADALPEVKAITFEAHMESLMARALGVVAMGGYNIFCEILSFDKRALIVPRTTPRREQLIRASRASELGLITMLRGDNERRADTMATALRQLPQQQRPSDTVVPGLLDGLENVNILTRRALEWRPGPALAARWRA